MTGAREAVAAAVEAANITGLSGSVWAPTVKVPGVVWAQWTGSDTSQYAAGTAEPDGNEWDVLCTLPADHPSRTAAAVDNWHPALLNILAPLGRVGRAQPVQLVLGDGVTCPALQIKLYT